MMMIILLRGRGEDQTRVCSESEEIGLVGINGSSGEMNVMINKRVMMIMMGQDLLLYA